MNDLQHRAYNAMIGLAIGDALSWTSMFHRSFLLPPWTRRVRREMDVSSETTNVIVTPMPFSLNQPAEHFNISPTNVTEWCAFTAKILLKGDLEHYSNSVNEEWATLAQSKETIRGGVSTQAALHNFQIGLLLPQTGKENPHYFDDGAMSRVIPIGIIYSGNPVEAARLAMIDASVTNSEDGIWTAQAMAVTISLLVSGKNITEAIKESMQYLPEASWALRIVKETMDIAERSNSIFSILPVLHNNIVNREYSYGNVAPETLALTFAIGKLHGNDFEKALTTATSFAKSAETLPAIVGALAGAMQTTEIASNSWSDGIKTLKGICIPSLAGTNYLELAEQLVQRTGKGLSL